MLIEKMEEYLISKGCGTIWIETNSFNTKALEFYKKNGYGVREVGLMKQVK